MYIQNDYYRLVIVHVLLGIARVHLMHTHTTIYICWSGILEILDGRIELVILYFAIVRICDHSPEH